jgi:cation:H+ antiporter
MVRKPPGAIRTPQPAPEKDLCLWSFFWIFKTIKAGTPTIVAAGTSLPELVTSIVAATKKNSDIAIGNVIGSNIFNILLIFSISSLIRPIAYNPKFNLDIYLLIGGTVFLWVAMLSGQRKKLDRWEAGLLFGFYLVYTVFLVVKEL